MSISLDVLLLFLCLWRVTAPWFFSLYSRACKNAWHIISAQDTFSEWTLALSGMCRVLWNFNCSKQIGVGGKMGWMARNALHPGPWAQNKIAPKDSVRLNAVDICTETQWCFFVSFGGFACSDGCASISSMLSFGHKSTKLTSSNPQACIAMPFEGSKSRFGKFPSHPLPRLCIRELPTCKLWDFTPLSDVTAGFPSEVVVSAVRVCKNVNPDKIGPQSSPRGNNAGGASLSTATQTSIMLP